MAKTIAQDDGTLKLVCDIPRCVEARKKRGQANGRYLARVTFAPPTISFTTKCPECGGEHTLTYQLQSIMPHAPPVGDDPPTLLEHRA